MFLNLNLRLVLVISDIHRRYPQWMKWNFTFFLISLLGSPSVAKRASLGRHQLLENHTVRSLYHSTPLYFKFTMYSFTL